MVLRAVENGALVGLAAARAVENGVLVMGVERGREGRRLAGEGVDLNVFVVQVHYFRHPHCHLHYHHHHHCCLWML